jgi:hypothetical protein
MKLPSSRRAVRITRCLLGNTVAFEIVILLAAVCELLGSPPWFCIMWVWPLGNFAYLYTITD